MDEWENYHIYYTELDRIILDCIFPFLQQRGALLKTWFWERHYAGGPHIRVRMRGSRAALGEVGTRFVSEVERYLGRNPSHRLAAYSATRARKMLELDGDLADDDSLAYRVNQITSCPYHRTHHKLASDEAAHLLESFLHDSADLVVAILQSPRPKLEEMLRLYLTEAYCVTAELPRGCVSFKSHWEGFTAFAPRKLVERVTCTYEQQKSFIRRIVQEIIDFHHPGILTVDPILSQWTALLDRYQTRVGDVLARGKHLTFQFTSREQVREARRLISENGANASPFLQALYEDDRFLASVQYEPRMLLPRVITNLLYLLVLSVGLTPIHKFALCYYAFRAVEERFECDLTCVLTNSAKMVVAEHAGRLETTT